jgi:hypothetical protein
MAAIDSTGASTPEDVATNTIFPDSIILRIEIDDLCTLPQCSSDFVYNFIMAVQGGGKFVISVAFCL